MTHTNALRWTSTGLVIFTAQGRTPLDLLSAELAVFLRPGASGGGTSTDVFAWGNGANYALVSATTVAAWVACPLCAGHRMLMDTHKLRTQ